MWNFDERGLLRRRRALDDGIRQRELDDALAEGELIAVGRGVYIPKSAVEGRPAYLQKQIRYRAWCVAAATRGRDDGSGAEGTDRILSHQSAAALHGLSLLEPDRRSVHVTGRRAAGGAVKGRATVFHTGPLSEDDVVTVDGLQVTSLARTAADVALSSSFPQALAVFDAARKRGVDPETLTERLERPRRGIARARRALRHSNPLAANPGESWCRAQIIEAGLPTPVLQKRYDLHDGSVAYVDHDFDGELVLEFDGICKYSGEYLGAGQAPADIVVAEKRREDGLRELGLDVIRAVWSDLRRRQLIPVLRRHLDARGFQIPGLP